MRAAVVDLATNIVVNVIVADSVDDMPPLGCFLVDIENLMCDIGWVYDPVIIGFINPNSNPIPGSIPDPIPDPNPEVTV